MAALDDTDSGALPGSNFLLHFFFRPVSDYHFSRNTHSGHNMTELAISVCSLVFIHEVHVDRVIWDFHVVLRMQVE